MNYLHSYHIVTNTGKNQRARDALSGRLTGITLGSASDAFTYDGFGELTGYQASRGGAALFAAQYTRDALGRITSQSETLAGKTTSYDYAYDPAGRLQSVRANSALLAAYSYDANGNRLAVSGSQGAAQGVYDAQDRLLRYTVGGTSITYGYTANGELQSKTAGAQKTTYTYDVLGNLLQVKLPNGTAISYVVDGQNRRIGKKVNGQLVQGFLYQDELRPIAELNGANQVVSRFVYASRANVPDYLIRNGVTYWIVADHLGSPRLVVNVVNGQIVQRLDYGPFGEMLGDSNPGFQPFGFAGGLYDKDTKLVRFGARDYDAQTGRWTAKDPILFAGRDTNLYGYVQNNPAGLTDPTGLDTYVCEKPLDALGGKNAPASERRSGPETSVNPFYHKYLCVDIGKGKTCGGQTQKNRKPYGEGAPSKDVFVPERCDLIEKKNWCMEHCVLSMFDTPYPTYSLINLLGQNCQSWVDERLAICRAACVGFNPG